jgi:hypothetical protein
MMPQTVFERLEGSWNISRMIEPEGSLTGTATFERRPDGWLAYREQGELHISGGSFEAERRYLFEPLETGFAVYFDERPPRLFHRIDLTPLADGSLTGEAPHPCGRDTYLSTYVFPAEGGFSIRHRVTGPNKEYTVQTLYTRRPNLEVAA